MGKGNMLPCSPHPQMIQYRGRGWEGSPEIALEGV